MILQVLLLSVTLFGSSSAYKILVVSPFPSRSHAILGDGVVNILSKAGHEITYITAYPHEKPLSKVKEIDLSSNEKYVPPATESIASILNNEISLKDVSMFLKMMGLLSSDTLENTEVQTLLKDPKQQFDVIIAEWMMSDLYAGLSAVYKCPFIWFSTLEPHWNILRIIDNIPNPAYNADSISKNIPPFNFLQRFQELVFQVAGLGLRYFSADKIAYDRILAPVIRQRGNPVPSFEELQYNVSLVLGNSHESIGKSMTLPPSYKAIGGFHIDLDLKPLPVDLQKLLDTSKNGVIYFSMGSSIKSKLMPEEMKQGLLKIFSTLKQTVLWKFEEDLPGRPNNVHIVQWAPQQSILAHPNCILFITHGGLLSTTEAMHFGKPIIVIPVFADQFSNANTAVAKGFAKKVDLSYTMADDLKLSIDEVLADSRFTTMAKELSMVYHDRLVPPGKELVHWVEHVVKSRGAPHLRSPALEVPLYQKLYLDLIGIVAIILYLIKFICKKIYVICCKTETKLKEKKKKL